MFFRCLNLDGPERFRCSGKPAEDLNTGATGGAADDRSMMSPMNAELKGEASAWAEESPRGEPREPSTRSTSAASPSRFRVNLSPLIAMMTDLSAMVLLGRCSSLENRAVQI